MSKLLPLLLAFGALVAACAVASEKPAPPRSIAPPTRIPDPVVPAPAGDPVDIASVPRAVRRAVVADAAKRFSVSENAVVLVEAERVTWSDGAMGCPEPGQMYTQMLVPGYRVSAKTSGGQMLYHTDSRGWVVSCAASHFQIGPKQLPTDSSGNGATPRTQPKTPDR